jgi:hypothetical protein
MLPYSVVIAELLHYGESDMHKTAVFRKWKHNADLCPMLEHQLNVIRESFLKHQSVVYDVQGPRDQGSDVLLRFSASENGEAGDHRFIIFQVKSYHDIKTTDYLKELRSQHFQTYSAYGESIEHYYLLLCTDIKAHRNQIRNIKNEFAKRPEVTVIDPAYVLTFLLLTPLRIGFTVEALLSEEDEVFKQARQVVRSLTPTQTALLLVTVSRALDGFTRELDLEELRSDAFTRRIYDVTPDYSPSDFEFVEATHAASRVSEADAAEVNEEGAFDSEADEEDDYWEHLFPDDYEPSDRARSSFERFAEDVEVLTERLFTVDGASGQIHVDPSFARPVQAIMLDARVRYGYEGEELLVFTMGALRVLERYGLESIGDDLEGG